MTRKQKYKEVINMLISARTMFVEIACGDEANLEIDKYFIGTGDILYGNIDKGIDEGLVQYVEKMED